MSFTSIVKNELSKIEFDKLEIIWLTLIILLTIELPPLIIL